MLVVTANWAIADGTLVVRSRRGQLEWLEAVHRAVIRAGVGRDGRYAACERLEIVLAGDTLDGLTTDAWLGDARPWHEGRRAERIAAGVLVRAAARGRRLWGGLVRWARGGLAVPTADRFGRPDWRRRRQVPVQVTLLPGDRDRWITAALPRGGGVVRLATAAVVAGIPLCHGSGGDPLWAGRVEPGRPTLGESLIVDFVARFAAAVRSEPWRAEAGGLVARLTAAPLGDLPTVAATWLAAAPPVAARGVRDRWQAAVAGWHRAARRSEPTCGAGCDPLDAVAAWLAAPGSPPGTSAELAEMFEPPPPQAFPAAGVYGHFLRAGTVGGVVGLDRLRRDREPSPCRDAVVACVGGRPPEHGPGHVVFSRSAHDTAWYRLDAAADRLPQAAVDGRGGGHHRIVEAA